MIRAVIIGGNIRNFCILSFQKFSLKKSKKSRTLKGFEHSSLEVKLATSGRTLAASHYWDVYFKLGEINTETEIGLACVKTMIRKFSRAHTSCKVKLVFGPVFNILIA